MNTKEESVNDTMEDPSQFCARFNIDEEQFNGTGLVWDELMALRVDFISKEKYFTAAGNTILSLLQDESKIHSLRVRVKDPDHLIAKIIRKIIEKSDRVITIGNYQEEITDLVGVRALHLLKEDWNQIDTYIKGSFTSVEEPIKYIRRGDRTGEHEIEDVDFRFHIMGYRSVHYTVSTSPTFPVSVEIQVRTLFEEAWSEIDHMVRYPHGEVNPELMHYIQIFNGLAGSADEMGSHLIELRDKFVTIEQNHLKAMNDKEELLASLEQRIADLEKLSASEKQTLQNTIDRMREANTTTDSKEYTSLNNSMQFPFIYRPESSIWQRFTSPYITGDYTPEFLKHSPGYQMLNKKDK
jgi:putative GTP pyrophosphokinase